MRLEPLGDQAVMAYCDDEAHAAGLAAHVRAAPPSWCIDVVQAYVSVAVYYDVAAVDFTLAADWLAHLPADDAKQAAGRLHIIPCCYEFGLDFERIQEHTGLSRRRSSRCTAAASTPSMRSASVPASRISATCRRR